MGVYSVRINLLAVTIFVQFNEFLKTFALGQVPETAGTPDGLPCAKTRALVGIFKSPNRSDICGGRRWSLSCKRCTFAGSLWASDFELLRRARNGCACEGEHRTHL